MDKKIITLLIILLFAAGIAYAADNTTNEGNLEDAISYITPVSFSENGIEFDDGFIGFSLDDDDITVEDEFTQSPTDDDELQNYIKLAIIECYKQDKEDDIGKIVASFCDGSYKNSADEIIAAVLDSNDKIGDNAVVELDDGSKATFDFELLKSSEDKSDCIAYKVSIDESSQNSAEDASDSAEKEKSSDDAKNSVLSASDSDEKEKVSNDTQNVAEDNTTSQSEDSSANENKTDSQANETNKPIVNKTNTVIVHEKNTTVITKNNVKNDTPQDTILKTAGNPLFILVVVVAIIAVVVFEKYRRG